MCPAERKIKLLGMNRGQRPCDKRDTHSATGGSQTGKEREQVTEIGGLSRVRPAGARRHSQRGPPSGVHARAGSAPKPESLLKCRALGIFLLHTSYRLGEKRRRQRGGRSTENKETKRKKDKEKKRQNPRDTHGDMDRRQWYRQTEWTDGKHTERVSSPGPPNSTPGGA